MTREEKELLLKDLCARFPYKVKVKVSEVSYPVEFDIQMLAEIKNNNWYEYPIPYLRPMSSMTEEEKKELLNRLPKCWGLEIDKLGDLYFDIRDASYPDIELLTDIIDWLNAHHFDYRNLIERGLAIDCTGLNVY